MKKKERGSKIEKISSLLAVWPFDEAPARSYAILRARLEARGVKISERDNQIAAIAVANGLTLVTHKVNAFFRVDNLSVEDWA